MGSDWQGTGPNWRGTKLETWWNWRGQNGRVGRLGGADEGMGQS